MRYIGGKENLLNFIDSVINEKVDRAETFADIFAGTAVVAKHFKKKNYAIISNDILYFSYLIQRTYIQNNSAPSFHKTGKNIYEIYDELNNLKGIRDYFFNQYAPSGKYKRLYLSDENAAKIDSIQKKISNLKTQHLISDIEEIILKCSLVEAIPFVSNISGTYGAYLKKWDKRAFKKLVLTVPEFLNNNKDNFAFNRDANDLVKEFETDILYLDPPYNSREYISNYHLLETVARNDKAELKGITGTRKDDYLFKSGFCKKNTCTEALSDLINNARAKYILLSYNSEGIIKDEEIQKIFKSAGKNYAKVKFSYSRFKSNSNGNQQRNVEEYIYFIETRKKYMAVNKDNSGLVADQPVIFNESIFNDVEQKASQSKTSVKGKYDARNQLNELTGKEWLYRTNSIEISETSPEDLKLIDFITEIEETKYSTGGKEGFSHNLRRIHPSPKPPQLMKKIIEFFTKEKGIVFDPFIGVGGTLLGAALINRQAIGIDLSKKYIDVYKEVCKRENIKEQISIVGNSKDLNKIPEISDIQFDLILTDPPYGNMMNKKKTGEATKKGKNTAPTPFTNNPEDLGNYPLPVFLDELKNIISLSLQKLKDKKYVVIFCKDFQPTPEYNGLLHYDIVNKLTEIDNLFFKGYKIWYDKTINLFPYGYPYSYISNQLHQFILIFQKRNKK